MASQEWLVRRLRGLRPSSFEQGICCIGCSAQLVPPREFSRVWSTFEEGDGQFFALTAQQLAATTALLIFSNPFLPEQVRATAELVSAIDAFGANAPPMFWLPHTVAPEVRPPEHQITALDEERGGELFRIMEMGLDGCIPDEPEGMKLALQVRMKIHKSDYMSQTLNNIINERRSRAMQANALKEHTHCILWDYLCVRMAPCIPPCNHNLPHERPTEIAGQRLGELLGRGTFGSVFALIPPEAVVGLPAAETQIREVIKIVDKSSISQVQAIKRLKRMIDVMVVVSSAQWQHPNLLKLHDIYHSRTHIMFRMEFGGPENLYQRLSRADRTGEDRRLLASNKVRTIVSQLISVVAHLHTGPGIVHRDLKPENVALTETSESVNIKLLDFDLALVLGRQVMCRNPCGTMPFTAPECLCLTESEYDGRAADIWSLGIILLEIVCGVRVLEKALRLRVGRPPVPDVHVMRRITNGLCAEGAIGKILQERCQAEYAPLLPGVCQLAQGMIVIEVPQRWKAPQVVQHLAHL